jgi:hypothetical protein
MGSSEYTTLQVTKLYQTLLHRQPDSAGLASNVQFLQQGGTIREVKIGMLGSAEYFQVRGGNSNTGWLSAVYADLLGRPLDPAGQQSWEQQLAMGVPRTSVALSIYLTPEATTRLVEQFYLKYLSRPADPGGAQQFAASLSGGASEESVISAMVTSDEFYNQPLMGPV